MRLDLIGLLFSMLGLCMVFTNPVTGLACVAAGVLMVAMGAD